MNWYRLTDDGSLDKEFLRTCAVHRCVERYGVSQEWAVEKLSKYFPKKDALALVQSWK